MKKILYFMLALSLLLSACDTKDLEIPNSPEEPEIPEEPGNPETPKGPNISMEQMNVNFKAYLLKNFDLDKDGEISMEEAALVKEMNCSKLPIASYEGIENFPNLERLDCSETGASTIDLSRNTALKILICNHGYRELDVSNNHTLDTLISIGDWRGSLISLKINPELKFLNILNHSLQSLDVSNHKSLKVLYCASNSLKSLDVSNSTLDSLFCTYTGEASLTELKIEGCTSLKHVSLRVKNLPLVLRNCQSIEIVDARGLSLVDVSDSPLLKELFCHFDSNISDLDLSNNPLLEDLTISNGVYNKLDLSNNLQLKNLLIANCYINDNLSLSNHFQLENISLRGRVNFDRNLDFSNCKHLKTFYYSHSSSYSSNGTIEEINFSGCTSLESVNIDESAAYSLKSLNVSGCQALSTLECSYKESLTEINLQGCNNLMDLQCRNNGLSYLDLQDCPNLLSLRCENNPLTELILSECTKLTKLYCSDNQLTKLKTNSEFLSTIDCRSNNSLSEIEIVNGIGLEYLDCSYNNLTELDLSDCRSLERLICNYNNNLTSLNINDCKSLKFIDCNDCSLIDLDVSNSSLLLELNCYNNQLYPTLDVSKCSHLSLLRCSRNELKEIIINRNIPINNISKDPETKLVLAD